LGAPRPSLEKKRHALRIPSKRKLIFLLALGGVLAVLALARVHWSDIAFWYEFHSRFERLGPNEQGCTEYRHRQTGIVLVSVPGGTCSMGSPPTEAGGWSNERPRHPVTLRTFLIAKFELRQSAWEAVMGSNPSQRTGDDLPVERVSWHDCREFNKMTGLSLPTEAQWEMACRGGTDTPFAFGETITSEQANLNGTFPYGGAAPGVYRRATVPVDSFAPNGFGLHNMHGNVAEWCADVYDEDFYGKPESRANNPLCAAGSGNRVVRGGGWFDRPRYCRSASRSWQDPAQRGGNLGFRPAFQIAGR
jgi:formylglycine-generating enzyme required for sulfatase activity